MSQAGIARERHCKDRSGLLTLAAVCWAGSLLLYVLAAHTSAGRRVDATSLVATRGHAPPFDQAVWLFDHLTPGSVALMTAALAGIGALRREPALGALAAVIAVGGAAAASAAKWLLRHGDRAGDAGEGFVSSYPSVHTATAFALALALVVVAPPRLRWYAVVLAAVAGFAMAVASLLIEAHRLSDVLGAFLIATGWAAAAAEVLRRIARPGAGPRGPVPREGWPGPGPALLALLAAAGIAATASRLADPGAIDRLAAVTAVVLLAAGLAALFRRGLATAGVGEP